MDRGVKLRLGVIGIGRRWRLRYKPALLTLHQRFEVRGLCDQIYERAVREARACAFAWPASALSGPAALLECPEIDAVLLLDQQWFGLWPIELACRLGKPVLCGVSLEGDDAHADALLRKVHDSRLPVMVEMLPRCTPAAVHLRELLASRIGPPRLLMCDLILARKKPRSAPRRRIGRPASSGALFGPPGIVLVDWCASLLDGEPVSVLATRVGAADFASVLLEFAAGRAAQITRHRAAATCSALRLQVVAEQGRAVVDLPGRISWSDREGEHRHVLPRTRPVVQLLLEHFYRTIREGRVPEPKLDDAHRALGWLRAAARSQAEGRRVAFV